MFARHTEGTDLPTRTVPLRSPRLHTESSCTTVREVLTRVGDKWSVLVISLLGDGALRFSQLQRSIEGISQRMLTLTLRQLERDGLVARTIYPTVPPRVDYALTPLGRTLLGTVMALADWAETHRPDIESARRAFDERWEAEDASP